MSEGDSRAVFIDMGELNSILASYSFKFHFARQQRFILLFSLCLKNNILIHYVRNLNLKLTNRQIK